MMRFLITCSLLLTLSGAATFAQDVADPQHDPSGVWMGQFTATGPNVAWLVTMTIAVRGAAARGIFEWIDLEEVGQTFTTFEGTWDATNRRATVLERVLLEELGEAGTAVGEYTIEFPTGEPGTARCAYRSGDDEIRGGAYFSRVSTLTATAGLAGRWQSLPGTTNPAMNLSIVGSGDDLTATGTALDRGERSLRPMRVLVQPVPGQSGRCTVQFTVGEASSPPVRYDGDLAAGGCLLRLSRNGQTAVLLVRRAEASPVDQVAIPPDGGRETWSVRCVGVSDGDTISVLHDGEEVRIRLNGIDCPERDQAFASVARQFTADAVHDQTVTVFPVETDQYGRTVADVLMPDGESLNEALVEAGLAWWFRRYAPDNARLQELEIGARQARRGLWRDTDPIPPWEFRRGR